MFTNNYTSNNIWRKYIEIHAHLTSKKQIRRRLENQCINNFLSFQYNLNSCNNGPKFTNHNHCQCTKAHTSKTAAIKCHIHIQTQAHYQVAHIAHQNQEIWQLRSCPLRLSKQAKHERDRLVLTGAAVKGRRFMRSLDLDRLESYCSWHSCT